MRVHPTRRRDRRFPIIMALAMAVVASFLLGAAAPAWGSGSLVLSAGAGMAASGKAAAMQSAEAVPSAAHRGLVGHPAALVGPIGGRLYNTTVTDPAGHVAFNRIAVDPTSQVLYSVNFFQGDVNMFSIPTGAFLGSYRASSAPPSAVSTDIAENHTLNRVYVSIEDGSRPSGGYILVLDATTLTLVTTIAHLNGTNDFQPTALLYDPFSTQLLVENSSAAIVAIVNTTTNTVSTVLPSPCLFTCLSFGGMAAVPRHEYVVLPTGEATTPTINTSTDMLAPGFTNSVDPTFVGGKAAYFAPTDTVWIANHTGTGDVWEFDQTGAPVSFFTKFFPGLTSMTFDPLTQVFLATTINNTLGGGQELWVDSAVSLTFAHYTNPSVPVPNYFGQVLAYDTAGVAQAITGGPYDGTTQGFTIATTTPVITPSWALPSHPTYQGPSASDPANGLYFVASQIPNQIGAFSESPAGAPVWSYHIASAYVSSLAVDPAQVLLYAAFPYASNVSIWSASTGAPLGTIVPPFPPVQIAVDPNNHRLYVASAFSGAVAVYDTTGNANTYLGTISNPGTPPACRLLADPAREEVFAASCNSPGNVTEMSGASLATTHVFPVGARPLGLGLGGGGLLYVANGGSMNVTVLNLTTNVTVNTIHVALGATGLVVDPALETLYMTNGTALSLTVVNGTTGNSVGALGIPSRLNSLAFDDRTQTIITPTIYDGTTFLASLVPLPTPPSGLSVTAGNTTLSATWTAATGSPGVPILNYTVYTSGTPGGPWTLALTTTSTSAAFTALPNGVAVFVSVRAVSAAGTSTNTSAVSGTPGAIPYPPTAVGAQGTGTSTINVSWATPASDGGFSVSSYVVWYGPSTSGPFSQANAGTHLTYNLTGLSAGTTYTVYVTAVNSIGHSAPSSHATASTAANPSTGLGSLSGSTLWIIVGIVVAALVVAALLMLLRRRGKSSAATTASPGPIPAWSEAPPPPPPPSGGGPPPGAV